MTELDFSKPCKQCAEGDHACTNVICGCIADHADDEAIIRGFKKLKRITNPEYEAWVKGGWSASKH